MERLPEYMVPSVFVMLKAMPLLPNGKVNRNALPAPDRSGAESAGAFLAPRTPTEETLARIWAEVLGVDRVGINDNFLELGGDSIIGIQVVARANQAGLKFTPRQIFHYQTIARLANDIGHDIGPSTTIRTEQGPVTGNVPLTPIQSWFLERDLSHPHHFNQFLMLELHVQPDADLLEKAVQCLVAHHDALRMRFVRTESGWRQFVCGLDRLENLGISDLSQVPELRNEEATAAEIAKLQSSLNLSEGPVLRFHLFKFGPDQPDRLFITVHHLVMDGVSWRILLEDLQTAYEQLRRNEAVQLPHKTTSFKHWAELLEQYANSSRATEDLGIWLNQAQSQIFALPLDCPDGMSRNTVESECVVYASLPPDATHALLREIPASYGTEINDVLLAAFVRTLSDWTQSDSFLIDLEGHGREEVIEGVDLSRTVGWFTALFPVLLHLERGASAGEDLRSTKEQLRRVPNHGIGYGLMRYLNRDPETTGKLRQLKQAEICFNYLGQFDQSFAESRLFRPIRSQLRLDQNAGEWRAHVLSVDASIIQGRLCVEWKYSTNIHRQATIAHLADSYVKALQSLIAHCQSRNAAGYTPSDFPEADLSQHELDAILGELGDE